MRSQEIIEKIQHHANNLSPILSSNLEEAVKKEMLEVEKATFQELLNKLIDLVPNDSVTKTEKPRVSFFTIEIKAKRKELGGMPQEFSNKDILSEYELKKVQEAFESINETVDRDTRSGKLIGLWSTLYDLIEYNEEQKEG